MGQQSTNISGCGMLAGQATSKAGKSQDAALLYSKMLNLPFFFSFFSFFKHILCQMKKYSPKGAMLHALVISC